MYSTSWDNLKQKQTLNFREQDTNLWVQALAYFARKEENCKTQIMEVLSHIDRRNLLPPLLVIQTLAHNSTATLAVVKVCLLFHFQSREMKQIVTKLTDQLDINTSKKQIFVRYEADDAKLRKN